MLLKRLSLLVPVISICLSVQPPALSAAPPLLQVRPSGEKYLYGLADTVKFVISANGVSGGTVTYRLSRDDGPTLSRGALELKAGKAVLRGALDQPGFLRCDVSLVCDSDTLSAACGCGVAVEAIQPTGWLPEDFDRFWRLTRSELLRHPVDPRVEEVAAVDPGDARRFKVSLAHPDGGRVYGWLHLPTGKGPFPAVLSIPGSGIGRTGRFAGFTSHGFAVLAIEVHGLEPGRENIAAVQSVEPDCRILFFRQVQEGVLRDYHELGKDDPYHYIHRRFVLAALRSLDYLCSREDIDTSRIAVFGGSQGGGLSLLTAAVDKRARAVVATVPGHCDFTAPLYGRCGGLGLLGDGDRKRVIHALSYYDSALAAGRIDVPTIIGVGFIDNTCHPTKVYAAYNNLKGPREIVNFYNFGHGSAPGWQEHSIAWLSRQFEMH